MRWLSICGCIEKNVISYNYIKFRWSESASKPSELALVDPLRHVSITRFILVIVVDVDMFDVCTFNTCLFESKKTSFPPIVCVCV